MKHFKDEHTFNESVASYREMSLYYFSVNDKMTKKIRNIAEHLIGANIKNVIVGISGGIDSTVVLGLLSEVKTRYIPELRIHGYCITFNDVYGDVFDSKYVDMLKNKYDSEDISITTLDGTNSLNSMISDLGLDDSDQQLLAQSSYALRYQMFFTLAQRHGAVTFGTTNRDEFEYVGWFGKNSDMVVDFQVITDWHKFEVVAAAKMLGIPKEIIERAPSGDLIDYSSDEANFGCTYSELAFLSSIDVAEFMDNCEVYPDRFYSLKYKKVYDLHNKNIHKYQGQTFNPIFIR